MLKIISLFSGCGGLDLGFTHAGFDVIWANEYDKTMWETYEYNHKKIFLDKRNILEIPLCSIPDCEGIIGGPPYQNWSETGTKHDINNHSGQLFYEYIKILKDKKPKFFLAENVSKMLALRNKEALDNILTAFNLAGYKVYVAMLDALDYAVPQSRKRIFFIGFRDDLSINNYQFPMPITPIKNLNYALRGLNEDLAVSALANNCHNENTFIPNHEYMMGEFSSIFMSRNRVRSYEEPSFTVQTGGRHTPIHPKAPRMQLVSKDKFKFKEGHELKYRRLTVRECARIQTFPDDFIFLYNKVPSGYKMIGNAVPVKLAEILGKSIMDTLKGS